MKKIITLIFFAAIAMSTVSAQDQAGKDPGRFRPKYTNINFASQKFGVKVNVGGVRGSADILKSNYGLGITTGRSYILHKNPLLGMIRIGLDATWFDMNYAHLQGDFYDIDYGGSYTVEMHQADISMGVGPSIHVNPIGKLGLHAYFRYNPTIAMLFTTGDGFQISGGYSSVFVGGGAVSWGLISVGAEARWGASTYGWFGEVVDSFGNGVKLKTHGFRAYLGFRF